MNDGRKPNRKTVLQKGEKRNELLFKMLTSRGHICWVLAEQKDTTKKVREVRLCKKILQSALKSYVYIISRGLSRRIWKCLLYFFSHRQGEYIFPYKSKGWWKKFLRRRAALPQGISIWGQPTPPLRKSCSSQKGEAEHGPCSPSSEIDGEDSS